MVRMTTYCTECGEVCELDSVQVCLESRLYNHMSGCCRAGYIYKPVIFNCAECDEQFSTREAMINCKHEDNPRIERR
jgi:hypothetical protein